MDLSAVTCLEAASFVVMAARTVRRIRVAYGEVVTELAAAATFT